MRNIEKKPAIVFFTHYSSMNGANQSLFTLIKYLKDKVEIKRVYVPSGKNQNEGLPKELAKIGILVEVLPLYPYLYFSGIKSFLAIPLKFIMNIPSWMTMYKKMRGEDIDWIYSNSSIENSGLIMARLLGKKHLLHVREFGFRDYNYYHLGGDKIKRMMFAKSHKLVAISDSIAEYINLPKKTTLVHNGIFYEIELAGIKNKEVMPSVMRFGMVGIISPTKNQKRAIRLIKNLVTQNSNPVKLFIYGGSVNDTYFVELQKNIETFGLNDMVSFEGFVNDKNEIYDNIDVLLMCSPSEAFGRVTIEAMAYGIPVIGYDNAGTAELINSGVNGFLYDDVKVSLEDITIKLLENRELYQKISSKSKTSAGLYSVERYGKNILKLLVDA